MAESSAHHVRVALVEDEAIFVMLLKAGLAKVGYEIAQVEADAPLAVAAILEDPPDVVVLDISLIGDMTGIEAARRIRSHVEVPILFLSGYPESEFSADLSSIGNYRYLTKPATVEAVVEQLEALLGKTRPNQP